MAVKNFLDRIKKTDRQPQAIEEAGKYIDLGEMTFADAPESVTGAKTVVRVAEVHKFEDLGDLSVHVYNGNIVVLDISPVIEDELALRRIVAELKQVAKDINGDVAGIDKHLLMLTPSGVKIDRHVLKATVF